MKRALYLLIALTSILSASCQAEQAKPERPNILLLLADDMGYGELGCYGQEVIKTPNIDALAAEGLRFTDFYAGTSVCSPSRASLMTGKHIGHLSIRGNHGYVRPGEYGRIALEKSEITVAEQLKKAGYQTAMIGKWHMGVPEDTSTWANGRGFDYAVQEQWGTSAEGQELDERMHWINNRQDSAFYDYNKYKCLDEFRTNFALEYLEQKDDSKPFFLYMSYRIPHAHEFFLSKNDLYNEHMQEWPEIERRHAARITMFDEQVQRLLDKLEEMGELENTLVLFTSDNGPHHENYHDHEFFKSSGGLKGHKRDLYEGGIRVPAIAYWKGKIEPGVTQHPATFYDVMPTFLELAKGEIPEQVDGQSFLPTLLGYEQEQREFLYWEIHEGLALHNSRQALRMGNWKAVRYGDRYHTELYDLTNDIYEENDVSTKHPDIVKRANELFKQESEKTFRYPYSGGIFK